MEALTAKPFITDENNASSLVILLFFAHSSKIIYSKIVTSRRHLLVGKRTSLAYFETLAELIFVLGIKLFLFVRIDVQYLFDFEFMKPYKISAHSNNL